MRSNKIAGICIAAACAFAFLPACGGGDKHTAEADQAARPPDSEPPQPPRPDPIPKPSPVPTDTGDPPPQAPPVAK